VDSAVLKSGESFTQIHNPAVKGTSRIFVTFRENMDAHWWVADVMDGLFVLKTDKPMTQDVPFDYWVMQVTDQRTLAAPAAEPVPAAQETASGAGTDPSATTPVPVAAPVTDSNSEATTEPAPAATETPAPAPVEAPVVTEPATP
jgi:hypothetical protein